MREHEPAGLSPFTPPVRPAPLTLPTTAGSPVAGRPVTRRLSVTRRSLRLAADVSQKITRSMRGAAKKAKKVSFTAWCWIKFKTQWQFWLLMTAVITGWWWSMQRPALADLAQARQIYECKFDEAAQLQARCNELRRVYDPLRRGDPYAWAMLARHQLGWKQKSEIISVDRKAAADPAYALDKLHP